MPESDSPPERRRPPTIRDVAKHAGVSKSLVSLVLRDPSRVSEKSRAAVKDAIDELGYRPSALARSLVSQNSGLLGIITSNAHDTFYADVLEGVSSYINASERALMPLILHGNHEEASESLAATRFLELRVEALMLMGSALSDAAIERYGREVPAATVGRWVEGETIDVVVNDDRRGGELAAKYLLDLGHRRVAHITGGTGNGAKERAASFRRTFEEAGCRPTIVPGTYLQAGGADGTRRLLETLDQPPTAIFAANDLAAIGTIDVLRRAGYRVPEDVSVMGYDDIALAALHAIDLTTINQPARQMGETAARLVCERVNSGSREGQRVLIEPALVVRSTTQPV